MPLFLNLTYFMFSQLEPLVTFAEELFRWILPFDYLHTSADPVVNFDCCPAPFSLMLGIIVKRQFCDMKVLKLSSRTITLASGYLLQISWIYMCQLNHTFFNSWINKFTQVPQLQWNVQRDLNICTTAALTSWYHIEIL